MPTLPYPLDSFAYCRTSQNHEDGIINAIIERIPMPRYFVEFGAEPQQCNCLELRRQGWDGLFMDEKSSPDSWIKPERVTPDNIEPLMLKYSVPEEFGVLSIDIDGQDIWVWRAIERRPVLVVIEYNNAMESGETPRDDNFHGQGQYVWGASLSAMNEVGESKGYVLVWANHVNAFFLRRDCFDNPDDFGKEKAAPARGG